MNLEIKGFTPAYIDYCKTIIEGLVILASNKKQYGLFGTKNNYRAIIDMLYQVKEGGIIPELLVKGYGDPPLTLS